MKKIILIAISASILISIGCKKSNIEEAHSLGLFEGLILNESTADFLIIQSSSRDCTIFDSVTN